MMSDVNRRLICAIGFIAATWFSTGCGRTEKHYFPASATARGALDATLKAWQDGESFGEVTGFSIPINVFDVRWQSGKKLESYEILSEEESEGAKTFIVNMKLNDDKESNEVKYLIVGINPLLVFREQDYKKASGGGG